VILVLLAKSVSLKLIWPLAFMLEMVVVRLLNVTPTTCIRAALPIVLATSELRQHTTLLNPLGTR
jgi:hypothetical protein